MFPSLRTRDLPLLMAQRCSWPKCPFTALATDLMPRAAAITSRRLKHYRLRSGRRRQAWQDTSRSAVASATRSTTIAPSSRLMPMRMKLFSARQNFAPPLRTGSRRLTPALPRSNSALSQGDARCLSTREILSSRLLIRKRTSYNSPDWQLLAPFIHQSTADWTRKKRICESPGRGEFKR